MNVGKSVNDRNILSRQVLLAVLANHNAPFRRLWANFCATLEPVYGKYAAVRQFSIWRPPSYASSLLSIVSFEIFARNRKGKSLGSSPPKDLDYADCTL